MANVASARGSQREQNDYAACAHKTDRARQCHTPRIGGERALPRVEKRRINPYGNPGQVLEDDERAHYSDESASHRRDE